MVQWRQDLKTGAAALLLLAVCVLPAVWYGAACIRRQTGVTVPAASVTEAPVVALTFDDGPRRETTSLLLDGLARRGVHATFFVVGDRLTGQEDILLRMAEEGHQVGIHSRSHKVLEGLNREMISAEVDSVRETLARLLGAEDFMLRPPYGFYNDDLCRWAGMPIVLWSVDPEDWSDHDVERQTAEILSRVKDGDIILLHDIYYASVETALQVTDALLKAGYRLVTVEELFAIRGKTAEAGSVYRSLPPGS